MLDFVKLSVPAGAYPERFEPKVRITYSIYSVESYLLSVKRALHLVPR